MKQIYSKTAKFMKLSGKKLLQQTGMFMLLLSMTFQHLQAQAPAIEWQRSMGGSSVEYAKSIAPTPDGGYIVAGRSVSNDGDVTGNHGNSDYWIVKLDASGNLQWQRSLGGSDIEVANSIAPTPDGGYIVAGASYSTDGDVTGNHGNHDYWIVKLDASGNLQWQKSLGGSFWDEARFISTTPDGGYIVAGYSQSNDGDVTGNHGYSDYWIVKLDASGNLQWQKSIGGSYNDAAYSIALTLDGGYIAAGYSQSNDGDVFGNHGSADYWIVKLDASGNLQWHRSLGGSSYDSAQSITPTSDGGFIVAGDSNSTTGDVTGNHGSADYWIVKLDASGNMQWQKSLGGSGYDSAQSITPTSDGGYIVAGRSVSNDGDVTGNQGIYDYWIVKLDASGNLQWQKSLGGSDWDVAESISPTSDAGYIVAGYSLSTDGDVTGNHGVYDYWIVKLNFDNDGDGVYDSSDNCPGTANSDQADMDSDGIGDVCDNDADGDGFTHDVDCDDLNAAIGSGQVWYADTDTDGFGNAAVSMTACTQPAGFVADNTDCNDSDATIYPLATEIANDGIDQDCNGEDLVEEDDCTAPTGVVLTRLSPTTAELTTDNSTQLYQGSANRAGRPLRPYPMYGMNSISSGHIQSGLVPAFDYDVWLRTICSDGTFTEWAGPFYLPTIETMAKVSTVKLTPNPAVQLVKVEGMKMREITIFDQYGRLILSTSTQSDEFDVSKLQSGIYSVQLKGENGEISVQQLIKK